MEPTTALIIAASAAAVGAGVSAIGTIQAGRAQAQMAEYNAQVAERDAEIATTSAAYEEAQFRHEGEELKSVQRARYAKSGVTMTGTPLLVLEDTAAQIERDALAIRYGGSLEAARATSAASMARFTGKQARTASYYRAGGSLLTGASQVAGYASQIKK